MSFRIGIGYDVHAFATGRQLILGGVPIPFSKGLAGHSDADVLTHALCDALLGATALGDLGNLFPDTDEQYKNISSLELLKKVIKKIRTSLYEIENMDAVIIAEQPEMKPFIPEMRRVLAEAMSVSASQISIKATTTEHLGFTGREEGIAVTVIVLLKIAEKT